MLQVAAMGVEHVKNACRSGLAADLSTDFPQKLWRECGRDRSVDLGGFFVLTRKRLGLVPEFVHLSQRPLPVWDTCALETPLHVLEALDEAPDRAAERLLGRDGELASEVREGEEGIPELVLDLGAIAGGHGGVELAQLLLHLRARPRGVWPVEPDPARLLGEAIGARERG